MVVRRSLRKLPIHTMYITADIVKGIQRDHAAISQTSTFIIPVRLLGMFDCTMCWWHDTTLGSSTCALTGFFWLLSHVIYLKLTKVFSFPNWVMSSKRSFSVFQAWGLNFLKTKFCQSSQIYLSPEKTEKTVYFLSLETFEW